jgi:hypothetical protein
MTENHPITPPPELVRQWATSNGTHYEDLAVLCGHVAARAAQWGYEQHEKELLDAMHSVVPQPYEPEAQ